ncbi:protein FAM13A-like [Lampris incognitus]|uniref:protein FAM13A-like n=1 Tax=Lampris incognitus TaxID=2546036 RepID=UPI0024B533F7|nr:protein FAM13A-like [Lampris incognitus]
MGASASLSICSDSTSVTVNRHNAKVSPEPSAPSLDPEARPVFGVALERLREDGQLVCGVPLVLRLMVEFLDREGVHQRGLFRLSPSLVRTRQLRQRWDHGERIDLQQEADVNTVASLLKLFLRELPTPVVPEPQRKELVRSLTENIDTVELNQSLRENLGHLPVENLSILSYLIHFLSRVAAHSQSNDMPVENLATVFGPCIFCIPAGPRMVAEQKVCNSLFLHLLRDQSVLFKPPHKVFHVLPPQDTTATTPPSSPPPPATPPSSPPPPALSALSELQTPPSSCCSEKRSVDRLEGESTATLSSTNAITNTWTHSHLNRAGRGSPIPTHPCHKGEACRTFASSATCMGGQGPLPAPVDSQTCGHPTAPCTPSTHHRKAIKWELGVAAPQLTPMMTSRHPGVLQSTWPHSPQPCRYAAGRTPPSTEDKVIHLGKLKDRELQDVFLSALLQHPRHQPWSCHSPRVSTGGRGGRSDSLRQHNDCEGRNNGIDSPSLKLQALEAELGPPPPQLVEPHTQENQSVQQHSFPAGDSNMPLSSTLPLHSPPPTQFHGNYTIMTSQPVQQEIASLRGLGVETDSSPPRSIVGLSPNPDPHPNASPLLQLIAASDGPVPSPRCPSLSHSLRDQLDPDVAPSPPCSQHIRMARCSARSELEDGAREFVSISMLNRHIHTLRKRIKRFEECFEQERHYKPAHNDKTAHPEVARLMKELSKSRKQLKELKLRQSTEVGLKEHRGPNSTDEQYRSKKDQQGALLTRTELQQLNNSSSNTRPSLEETVQTLTARLKDRHQELGLPDSIKEMSQSQMALEKTSLQKCLLYFESVHGRPSSRQERTLMKPFYDRYRLLKQLLFTFAPAPVIPTIEEEEGSDEECMKEKAPSQQPHTGKSPRYVSSDESLSLPVQDLPETPLVSPLEEVKEFQPQVVTMAKLHQASRPELLDHLRMTRLEKRRLHQALREFEDNFYAQTGRTCQKEDRGPMAEEYCQYKNVKAKLRLLEALLSKQQDSTKTG